MRAAKAANVRLIKINALWSTHARIQKVLSEGVQLIYCYETLYFCDFTRVGGGETRPPVPPLDPRMRTIISGAWPNIVDLADKVYCTVYSSLDK